MKFRLFYRGTLKANGGAAEKQQLRRAFLPQFKNLWQQSPLSDARKSIDENELIQLVSPFRFLPLVQVSLELVASLDITFLRPEEPGNVITQGGDIDNRLKTLLDSLQMPKQNQIPNGDMPQENEDPFYCLLEDDNLITSLSITTDRLLDNAQSQNEVILLIHVNTEFTHQHFTNMINRPKIVKRNIVT